MADKFVARAHHAYTKAKPDEIDLSPGDILRVANNDHDAWWVGFNESTKERGWFPSNFVSRVESKPKAKSKRFVRCIKQYDAVDEDDLSLQVGDIVEVRKELDGWYLGIIDGRKGMFPASYTEETGGPASAEDTSANEPARRPLPVPPVPGGGSGAAAPISPPSLPQRQPPLPPRASTDIQRGSDKLYSMPGADDGADDGSGKKEKQKSGHRISRLFGTKKNKNKDVAEPSEAAAHGALSPLADEPPTLNDGDNEEQMDEEVVISPALPSRPLPQPSVASPPPAPSRPALPPIPPMGLAKAPPVPSAAAPPVPGAISTSASQSTAAAARRPSVSSTKSAGSAALPLPGLPPLPAQEGDGNSGKENDTVDEDANQDEETNDDGESVKARGVARLAKIVEDYEAAQPEELNLMSGDVVTIISRGTDDDPRWKGEYHGKKGYFPSHVVEAIEESADLDEEEAESSGARPKGFKLAAYGVQQGGLGSVFAGGGMPTLRRAAPPPRKTDDDEGGSAAAPVPVLAPVPAIPKLRSVQRPPAAKEEQVNFLAQLSRVPRKQTSSIPNDESIVSPEPAAAAPLPISRKSTANSAVDAASRMPPTEEAAAYSEEEEEEAGEIEDGAMDAEEAEETEPARGAPMLARVPDLSSEEAADAAVPEEADAASDHLHGAKAEAGEGSGEEDGQAGEANAEDQAGGDDDEVESGGSGKASGLDPVKSPALAGVKRLVRRAPRQKPTAEGLKKNSEDSQSQSLHSALKKDRELAAPEAEATPRAAPPALPEKPRGLARHGQFSGPQLPTGGFKATGRIGSAMASRLAALQARASGAAEDDGAADDNDAPSARAAAPALSARSPPPQPDAAPSPVVKRPSFNVRTAAAAAEPGAATAAVPQEWQRQIEGEQSRLRSDVDAAKRAGSQVDQLASRLAASEHESQAHKQTISGLERQIESLAAQVAAMASSLTGIQRSVAGLEASKGVTAKEVSAIVQTELKAATQPLQHQSQELWSETKTLHTKISDLRAYVDELVVEEEN